MSYGSGRREVRPWVTTVARIIATLVVITLVVGLVGGGGYFAYQRGWIQLGKPSPEPIVAATPTPPVPQPTAAPSGGVTPGEELPEFTCVLANYPSYYTAIDIAERFDEKWGIRLHLIPMESGPEGTDYAYSEDEQAELLRSGQVDCLLTTLDTFRQGPYGQLIFAADMSRGADMIAAYQPDLEFNDLVGRPIAVALSSVSEFFTIITYRIIGADPSDPTVRVTVPGVETAEQALAAYRAGEAVAVAAWVPVIYEGEDKKVFTDVEVTPGEVESIQVGYKVIDSARIPAITDVVIISNQAIEQRPEVVQAFTYAWLDALNQMFQNPERAAETIIEWDRDNYEWTGLEAYATDQGFTPGEALVDYMFGIAQAGFWPNVVLMQDHADYAARGERSILARQVDYALDIWRSGGVPVATVDSRTVINPTFILEAYRRHPELMGDAQPLFTDYPFVLHGDDPLRHIFIEGDIPQMDIIASLPKIAFEFIQDTGTLKPEYADAFADYMLNKVKPALAATSSDVGLVCTVGAAWPEEYTREQMDEFLRGTRIKDVSQLMGGTYMVDMTRVTFRPWLPETRGDVRDEYRFIQCELGALGGR